MYYITYGTFKYIYFKVKGPDTETDDPEDSDDSSEDNPLAPPVLPKSDQVEPDIPAQGSLTY